MDCHLLNPAHLEILCNYILFPFKEPVSKSLANSLRRQFRSTASIEVKLVTWDAKCEEVEQDSTHMVYYFRSLKVVGLLTKYHLASLMGSQMCRLINLFRKCVIPSPAVQRKGAFCEETYMRFGSCDAADFLLYFDSTCADNKKVHFDESAQQNVSFDGAPFNKGLLRESLQCRRHFTQSLHRVQVEIDRVLESDALFVAYSASCRRPEKTRQGRSF